MASLVSSRVVDTLKAEGLPLPDECVEVRLVMATNSAICLQYAVLLTPVQLVQLGRALARLGEDEK